MAVPAPAHIAVTTPLKIARFIGYSVVEFVRTQHRVSCLRWFTLRTLFIYYRPGIVCRRNVLVHVVEPRGGVGALLKVLVHDTVADFDAELSAGTAFQFQHRK